MAQKKQGQMSVRDAGHKGGQKVKQLIEEGKRAVGDMAQKSGKR